MKSKLLLLIVFLATFFFAKGLAFQSFIEADKQCQDKNGTLMSEYVCQLPNYDLTQPPFAKTKVLSKVKLVELSDLNENRMTITTKLTMSVSWNESRLAPVGNWGQARIFRAIHYTKAVQLWLPYFHVSKLIRLEGKTF